eukprot:10804525-Lingulodinium_polyedra.AAC.1
MATEVAGRLSAEGLTPDLDWPHEAGLHEPPPDQQRLTFGEVLCVDDAAYPVPAATPTGLRAGAAT